MCTIFVHLPKCFNAIFRILVSVWEIFVFFFLFFLRYFYLLLVSFLLFILSFSILQLLNCCNSSASLSSIYSARCRAHSIRTSVSHIFRPCHIILIAHCQHTHSLTHSCAHFMILSFEHALVMQLV